MDIRLEKGLCEIVPRGSSWAAMAEGLPWYPRNIESLLDRGYVSGAG